MSRRSNLDAGSVTGGLVNEAYDKVKLVADNIEVIDETIDVVLDFNGRFYAPRAIETDLDDLGNESTQGDSYFNTSLGIQRVYNGSAWQDLGDIIRIYKPRDTETPFNDLGELSLAGDMYFNTVLGAQRVFTGTVWQNVGSVPTDAAAIGLLDSNAHYDALNVEDALEEVITKNDGLMKKVVDIGVWDMTTDPSVNVLHTLDVAKIRSVSGLIMRDDQLLSTPITLGQPSVTGPEAFIGEISATNIGLYMIPGGWFDHVNYSVAPNRGWLVIEYVA